MRAEIAQRLNAITVSAYKVLGFAALVAIMAGLAAYLAMQGFFLASRSWVAPVIVSPTDEKVLQLNAKVAEEISVRDRLVAEHRDLAARLAEAERTALFERRFQARLREALRAERTERAAEIAKLAALREEFDRARDDIADSNRAYAGLARVRGDQLREASLLDREGYLTLNHQLAQMSQTNLSLARDRVDLETRVSALGRELRGLGAVAAIADGEAAPRAASTRTLDLEQHLARSQVALARAEESRAALAGSVADAEAGIGRLDALIAALRASPWVRAAEQQVTLAFVPYANAGAAREGAPLYGCAVGFVACRRVGSVAALLPGETKVRHPVRNRELRGVLAEIRLDDPRRARDDILHLGRKPLLF